MLPQSIYEIEKIEEQEYQTLTYKFDFDKRRIVGKTDELEAILQMVRKVMNTERFTYEIYTDNYGVELENLIGETENFVVSVLKQRITDALKIDNRIISINDFIIEKVGKQSLTMAFTVDSIYGEVNYISEVKT